MVIYTCQQTTQTTTRHGERKIIMFLTGKALFMHYFRKVTDFVSAVAMVFTAIAFVTLMFIVF